jgi:hypothetical protein
MLGSLRRSILLAGLAILGACTGAAPSFASQPTMISAAPRVTNSAKRNLFGAIVSSARYGRKPAGVSMAQQQRTAAKKRGVARNRRHHR